MEQPEKGVNITVRQKMRNDIRFPEGGIITLMTKEGEQIKAGYLIFNNTCNTFVFIFSKGEKNRAKTKVILQ